MYYSLLYTHAGIAHIQERLWRETLVDDSATVSDCRRGKQIATEINPKLLHDIQVLLRGLVGKASQLIGNLTTNLAETWMHITLCVNSTTGER